MQGKCDRCGLLSDTRYTIMHDNTQPYETVCGECYEEEAK